MLRYAVRACATVLLCALTASAAAPPSPDKGVLPTAADGRPLNLDFETGTLKDWTAEGEAFALIQRPGCPRRARSGGQEGLDETHVSAAATARCPRPAGRRPSASGRFRG